MSGPTDPYPWDDGTIQRLGELWDEGLSAAEIGRRLGVSKNAVVGKARRLGLPERESPIKRGVPAAPKQAPRKRRVATLPKLASVAVVSREPAPPPAPIIVPRLVSHRSPCQWPFGEPGTREFRFCGSPQKLGSPYCADHHKVAYRKVVDLDEVA